MAILAPYLHGILFVNISASPEASLREHKFHFVLYASRLHHRHQRVKNISWLSKDPFIFFICFVIAATVTCSLQRIRQTHVTSLLTCTGNHSQSWLPIIKLLWEVTDSNAGLGNYLTSRTTEISGLAALMLQYFFLTWLSGNSAALNLWFLVNV